MQDEPDPVTPTKWLAIINPLIGEAIEWKADVPRTLEEEAVRKWAQGHDISPLGLNLPVDDNGKPAWDTFWEEIESSSEEETLSILGVLEEIGAGLFGVERQDRIIITYRDPKNLERSGISLWVRPTHTPISPARKSPWKAVRVGSRSSNC